LILRGPLVYYWEGEKYDVIVTGRDIRGGNEEMEGRGVNSVCFCRVFCSKPRQMIFVLPCRESSRVLLVVLQRLPHQKFSCPGGAVLRILDGMNLPNKSPAVLCRWPPVRRDEFRIMGCIRSSTHRRNNSRSRTTITEVQVVEEGVVG